MSRRLWSNRSFAALWLGQAVSSLGDYFSLLAIPIYVNRLTGSVMLVGLSFIISTLPALLLGPVAGVFVDRYDRRVVMIVADVLRGVLMLCLALVRDASQVWVIYLVGFLVSCSAQFFAPARGAALPLIVTDPADWLEANSAMRLLQTVGMLAGPALAGVTISQFGERAAFIADGASFLVSAAAVTLVRLPSAPSVAATTVRAVWHDLREGMAYMLGNRTTLGVLVCMSLATTGFATVNMLWIPYLQRTFGVGAAGLGAADAALGAGMLLSGLLVGRIARRLSKTTLSALGLALIGGLYMSIVLLPAFGWIIAWQFIAGLALIPMQSALDTIVQLAVPDRKRGRVGAAMNAAYSAAGVVAMGLAATFGQAFGLGRVFVLIGGLVLAAGLLGFWLMREPEEGETNLERGAEKS